MLHAGAIQVVADGATLAGSTDLLDYDWHQFLVVLPEGGSLDDAAVYIDGVAETVTTTGVPMPRFPLLVIKLHSSATVHLGSLKDGLMTFVSTTGHLAASEADKLFKLEENPNLWSQRH